MSDLIQTIQDTFGCSKKAAEKKAQEYLDHLNK